MNLIDSIKVPLFDHCIFLLIHAIVFVLPLPLLFFYRIVYLYDLVLTSIFSISEQDFEDFAGVSDQAVIWITPHRREEFFLNDEIEDILELLYSICGILGFAHGALRNFHERDELF